ncbi:hypothetical protein [Bufonid herpesvirus 1]|uniref:hypothetical protein n=1 Tax=Bufonid herpesvirus 1 TaxID=2282206 RepID=UPI000EB669D4|nr:hypothetical protein [Bufonid herpesvirus 1]AXF48651.1 hypothetical protein [Bufonid herpesvirus 1]
MHALRTNTLPQFVYSGRETGLYLDKQMFSQRHVFLIHAVWCKAQFVHQVLFESTIIFCQFQFFRCVNGTTHCFAVPRFHVEPRGSVFCKHRSSATFVFKAPFYFDHQI